MMPTIVKFDNNVNENSTTIDIMDNKDTEHANFPPTTDFVTRDNPEHNDFRDDKSLISSFSEKVKLLVFKVYQHIN